MCKRNAGSFLNAFLGVEFALDLCQWPFMAFEQVWPHRGGGPLGCLLLVQKRCGYSLPLGRHAASLFGSDGESGTKSM